MDAFAINLWKNKQCKTESQMHTFLPPQNNMHSFYSTPYTNTHFHYYKPLIPVRTGVLFSARPAYSKGQDVKPYRNARTDALKQTALFKEGVKKKENGEIYWAFTYFFDGVNSLNIWNDAVKYTCWCCDTCGSTSKNIDEYNKEFRQAETDHDYNAMITARQKALSARWCSDMFTSHKITKYMTQYTIMIAYFIMYVLLIVFYQDTSICWINYNSLNPNHHTITTLNSNNVPVKLSDGSTLEQSVDQCWEIRDKQCKIYTMNTEMSLFEYARIRFALYTISFTPFIFLYCCMQAQLQMIIKRLDPNRADYIDKTEAQTKTLKKASFFERYPVVIKNLHLILFVIVYSIASAFSLMLDLQAVHYLKDCKPHSDWSMYLKTNPNSIPQALLAFNILSSLWAFIYAFSKLGYYIQKGNLTDVSIEIDTSKALTLETPHTQQAREEHAKSLKTLEEQVAKHETTQKEIEERLKKHANDTAGLKAQISQKEAEADRYRQAWVNELIKPVRPQPQQGAQGPPLHRHDYSWAGEGYHGQYASQDPSTVSSARSGFNL